MYLHPESEIELDAIHQQLQPKRKESERKSTLDYRVEIRKYKHKNKDTNTQTHEAIHQ